jgi:predicted DNA-binding transcriptional regulator AlpA
MHLLNTAQAAERIGMSVSWLNHARQTGEGPVFLKIGVNVKYRVEDVDAWLASKTRTRVWQFDGEAA